MHGDLDIELYVQWGFLALFGAACPAVIVFACATNYIETRTDGYKLFNDYRRVLPFRVDGIGEPLQVFYFTLYLAVPVNAGLIVYTFGSVRFLEKGYFVWVFVGIIGALLVCLKWLDILYPDVPAKTLIQLERQRVVYERIVMGNPDDTDTQLDLEPDMVGLTVAQVKAAVLKDADSQKPTMTSRDVPSPEVELSYLGTKV